MTQFLINAILWVVLIGVGGFVLSCSVVAVCLWRMFWPEIRDAKKEMDEVSGRMDSVRQRIQNRVIQ